MRHSQLLASFVIVACGSHGDHAVEVRDAHRVTTEAVLAKAKSAEATARAAPTCAAKSIPAGLTFGPTDGNTDTVAIGDHDLYIRPQIDRVAKLLADPKREDLSFDPHAEDDVFAHVENLRYLLIVRVLDFQAGTLGEQIGMNTFDPGAVSGDATLVDLTTGAIAGCAPWSMQAPAELVSLDPADPSSDLADHQNTWSRQAIAGAVGAGSNDI